MTLYSSSLFPVWPASGCIDNLSRLPASPWLPDEKTLAFGTTIHFVRGSKILITQTDRFFETDQFERRSSLVNRISLFVAGFGVDSSKAALKSYEVSSSGSSTRPSSSLRAYSTQHLAQGLASSRAIAIGLSVAIHIP